MPELQDIFAQYADAYAQSHPLSLEQGKVVRAIQNCRTCCVPLTSTDRNVDSGFLDAGMPRGAR